MNNYVVKIRSKVGMRRKSLAMKISGLVGIIIFIASVVMGAVILNNIHKSSYAQASIEAELSSKRYAIDMKLRLDT